MSQGFNQSHPDVPGVNLTRGLLEPCELVLRLLFGDRHIHGY